MPPPTMSPRVNTLTASPARPRTAAEISTDDRSFTRFRAPAHKHAHHLHSIPPREKSTRTLILDHILWVHALTRLAQARAELGMTNLCPPSPQEASTSHQPPYNPLRPESYAHAALESDGEEDSLVTLRSRVGNPGDPHLDTEDQRLYEKQDLDLARGLRMRSEALEKVIVATLDGMPRVNVHENTESELSNEPSKSSAPHSSGSGKGEAAAGIATSKAPAASSKDLKQPIKPAPPLPNGVRLRLGLGTVINDLFSRCPPPPPPPPRRNGERLDSAEEAATRDPPLAVERHTTREEWPAPLRQLAKAAHIDDEMSPEEDPALAGIPRASRARALYAPGADPATANSPAEMRCPRHLHNGCGICVIADEATTSKGKSHASGYRVDSHGRFFGATNRSSRPTPSSRASNGRGRSQSINQGSSSDATRSPIQRYATMQSNGQQNQHPSVSAFKTPSAAFAGIAQGNGLTGYLDGAGIGTGLAGAGSTGHRSVLRRGDGPDGAKPPAEEVMNSEEAKSPRASTSGGPQPGDRERDEEEARRRAAAATTSLAALIPRFLRLSALVAKELGREAKEGKDIEVEHGPGHTPGENADEQEAGADGAASRNVGPAVSSGASIASSSTSTAPYIPTAHWYLLLAGLLTRAALEGYLSVGWTGRAGVRALLGLGVGGPGSMPAGRARRRRVRRRDSTANNQEEPVVLPPRHSMRSPGPAASSSSAAADPRRSPGELRSKEPPVQSEVESSDEEEDEFAPYDPDELPSLQEAVRLLFPTLARRLGVGGERSAASGTAEEAYIIEMEERMRRFYTIPEATPDLSTHMEDLAWQYPAEPVERAAVRFCESVCRWRGNPEIESYRKPVTASSSTSANASASNGTDSSPLMPMNALVHSNPTSPVVGVGASLPSTNSGFPAVGVPYQWGSQMGMVQATQSQGPQPSEASAADDDEMVMPQKNTQPSVETYFAPAFSAISNAENEQRQQQQQQQQNQSALGLSYPEPYPGMYGAGVPMDGQQPPSTGFFSQPGYSSYAPPPQNLMPPPPAPTHQQAQQNAYVQRQAPYPQSYATTSSSYGGYAWGNVYPPQTYESQQQQGDKRQRSPGAERASPGRGEKRVRF